MLDGNLDYLVYTRGLVVGRDHRRAGVSFFSVNYDDQASSCDYWTGRGDGMKYLDSTISEEKRKVPSRRVLERLAKPGNYKSLPPCLVGLDHAIPGAAAWSTQRGPTCSSLCPTLHNARRRRTSFSASLGPLIDSPRVPLPAPSDECLILWAHPFARKGSVS